MANRLGFWFRPQCAANAIRRLRHPSAPLPPIFVFLLLILFASLAVWTTSAFGVAVSMAAARVVPPVPSGPFACDRSAHATRVHHAIPSFSAGGPSCLTVSANRCTYEMGLQITLPSLMPPSGMNPLVRILIYQSFFLSTSGDDPPLLIQSINIATSQHYRLEVVIANSTIRAERTIGGGAHALRFSSVHLSNANITVYGCHIVAFDVSATEHITNSTIQLLSSAIEAIGLAGAAFAAYFSSSPLADTRVNVTGSLLNATSSGRTYGLFFTYSPLFRSCYRLFDTHIVSRSSGALAPSYGLQLESSALLHSTMSMYEGSMSAQSERSGSYLLHIVTPLTEPVELSNSVLSFHGTALSALGNGNTEVALIRFYNVHLSSSIIEAIGGSFFILKGGAGVAYVFEFGSAIANRSTIRTNETAIACEGTEEQCVLLLLRSPTDSLFGFYGSSLVFRGHYSSILWQLFGTSVSSHCFCASRQTYRCRKKNFQQRV